MVLLYEKMFWTVSHRDLCSLVEGLGPDMTNGTAIIVGAVGAGVGVVSLLGLFILSIIVWHHWRKSKGEFLSLSKLCVCVCVRVLIFSQAASLTSSFFILSFQSIN